MECSFEFRDKFIKISLCVAVVVTILTTTVMLTYASKKTVILSEADTEEALVEAVPKAQGWTIEIPLDYDDSVSYLSFPMPSNVTARDVSYLMNYSSGEFSLVVENTLYRQTSHGNFNYIESGEGTFDGSTTTLSFKLSETVVPEVSYYNKEARVSFVQVSKIAKPIVLIDPGHGGTKSGTVVGSISEKEQVMKLAKLIEEKTVDKPYTVLLTRTGDMTLSTEDRINTIKLLDADYYIGLHLLSDPEDTKLFGMKAAYNGTYYHGKLENAEFAAAILKAACESALDKAIGVSEAGDDEVILKLLDIPATVFYAGYLSNEDEARLLSEDSYLEKIAEGIVNALDGVVK